MARNVATDDRLSLWPERLIALVRTAPEGDPPALSEVWVLLNLTLRAHVRSQGRKLGNLSREDVEDLASQKALELVRQLDCGKWNPGASSPGEVVRFVSTVARNGVVDWVRRQARGEVPQTDAVNRKPGKERPPDARVERREFARALVDCVTGLQDRHRCIWILRTFYEMSGKRIAVHPEVGLSPGNIDVILNRTRKRVSRCLEGKGFTAGDLPPGSFADIWEAFRMESFVRSDGRSS